MEGNYWIVFVTGIIPMLVGGLWYGPLFGKAWMRTMGFTEEDLQGGNMLLIMGLSYVLSVAASIALLGYVVHQTDIASLFAMDPDFNIADSETRRFYDSIMERIGEKHRHFGHGALHGGFTGLLFVTPIIAIKAMFERKTFKYIALNAGYWLVTLILMGGVLCHFF